MLRAYAAAAPETAAPAEADDPFFEGTPVSAQPPERPPRVNGHGSNLPAVKNLQEDGSRSLRDRIPVLLFFDLWDCPYCDRALKEFLVPMANGAEWRSRAIYRQVEIDKAESLVDFGGQNITHRDLALRFKVKVTPTLWLVDGRGEALGKPLVGLMTPDFYGAYLERAINDATARLRGG